MATVFVNDGELMRLRKALRKLNGSTLKEMNQVIAETLRSSTKRRFNTSISPEGQPWKRSLRHEMSQHKTLVDTARLKNSILSKATEKGAEVGTNVIYASRHQFGDKTPLTIRAKTAKGLRFKMGDRWVTKKAVRVKMPARPFLGISDEDMKEIKAVMDDVLKEQIK